MMRDYTVQALAMGFTAAAEVPACRVVPEERIRALCNPEQCKAYGTNWVCPPGCGELNALREKLKAYSRALVLQCRTEGVDTADMAKMEELSAQNAARVLRLRELIGEDNPNVLSLSTGGCRECEKCAWPEPCRIPEKNRGSLSGYGIDVGALCAAAGMDFAFVPDVLTLVACVLY